MKIGLFIGRFQPFHIGHLADVKASVMVVDRLIIAIGSSQYENEPDNPFSSDEREEMINNCLAEEGITSCELRLVPDINDDGGWVDHVIGITGKPDIVFTGNRKTSRLFSKAGYKVFFVDMVPNVCGSVIRDRIISGKEWRMLLPKGSLSVVERVDGCNRIRRLGKNGSLPR